MQNSIKMESIFENTLHFPLFIETRVHIIDILFSKLLLGEPQAFAEALEMNDLARPQELYNIIYIRVITQTQDIIIGYTSFLLCCNHIRTTFN